MRNQDAIAVGTLISERTDPYGRDSRIRLPRWVFDDEALAWPGMGDPRLDPPRVGGRL